MSSILRSGRTIATCVAGLVGTALGACALATGIVDAFLGFLDLVGYVIPAIPGVIICDYYVVRRMRYTGHIDELERIRWRGLLSYAVAVGISIYLGMLGDVLVRSTPIVGFVVALLVFLPWIVRSRERRGGALSTAGKSGRSRRGDSNLNADRIQKDDLDSAQWRGDSERET